MNNSSSQIQPNSSNSFRCYVCQTECVSSLELTFKPCGHKMCEPCFRRNMKALSPVQDFVCGLCRAKVENYVQVKSVPTLKMAMDKRRNPNANLQPSHPSYRFEVQSIIGIRCHQPLASEVEYLVDWKPIPTRRKSKPTWERAIFFDKGAMIDAFHARYGLFAATDPRFDFNVSFEFKPSNRQVKKGKVQFKCSQCEYTSNRKTNMDAHMESHRLKSNRRAIFGCPRCEVTFSNKSNQTRHVKRCIKQVVSVAPTAAAAAI